MKLVLHALVPCALLALAPSSFSQEAANANPTTAAVEFKLPASPLGLSGLLPADVEMAFSLHGIGPLVRSVLDSNMVAQLAGVAEKDLAELNEVRGILEQGLAFAGDDLFVALAAGSASDIERLMLLNSAYERASLKMLEGVATGGDFDLQALAEDELYADGGRLMDELVMLQLPRFLMGIRPSEGFADMLLGQALDFSSQLPPFILHDTVQIDGLGTFHTWHVDVVDALPPGLLDELAVEFGEELAGDILRVISSKTVELAIGVVDGALLVSLGPDREHLRFATSPASGLAATEELRELMPLSGSRDVLSVGYVSKAIAEATYIENQMAVIAEGVEAQMEILAGLLGVDLGPAGEHLTELFSRLDRMIDTEPHASAFTLWREHGIKGASVGGSNQMGLLGDRPLLLAALAPADALLVAGSAMTREMRERSLEITELAALLAQDAARAFRSMEDEVEDSAELGQILDVADLMTPVIVDLWSVIKDEYHGALGEESAVFMDFGGDLPLTSGVPAVLLEHAPFPRIAIVNDVTDRAKLAAAWERIPAIVEDFTARVQQLNPNFQFVLPTPQSSSVGAQRSHAFKLGIERKNFAPALTLTDRAMVLGSSRSWNETLLNGIDVERDTADLPRGTLVSLRLDALHAAAAEWMTLVRENLTSVFGEDIEGALEFKSEYPKALQAMKALSGIHGLELQRSFDGRWRTSWHIHITDSE